jgi:hypothetical protein
MLVLSIGHAAIDDLIFFDFFAAAAARIGVVILFSAWRFPAPKLTSKARARTPRTIMTARGRYKDM